MGYILFSPNSEMRNAMFRHVVSRLLVPLFLIPAMCPAHAHSGTSVHDPSGLNRAPHFHLRFFYLSWQQCRNEKNYYCRPESDEYKALAGRTPTADHDDDAVYLPLSVLLGWRSNSPVAPVDPSGLATLAGTICVPNAAFVLSSSQEPSPPAAHWQLCPIYLRSLTLLI